MALHTSQSAQGAENLYLIPEGALNKTDVQSWLCAWVAHAVDVDLDLVSPVVSLASYELTNVELTQLLASIEESSGVCVGNSTFMELETISDLAEYICGIAIDLTGHF